MFANTLLECAPSLQNRRRWTLLLSLTLQMTAVSLSLIYPLLHPERLPFISTVPKIASSAPTFIRVVPAGNEEARQAPISHLQWPQQLDVRHNGAAASTRREPNELPSDGGPFIGTGPAGPPTPFQSPFNSPGTAVVRLAPVNTKPLRLSNLEEGRLLEKIQPIYPPIAKQFHIQGDVQLTALIAKDGSIEGLRVISGHPMLIPAALQAVSQWRYKPYILNGSATEVETTIKVTFRLEQ